MSQTTPIPAREWSFTTEGPEATRAAAEALGALLEGGEVIGLVGDLGTGKTCFTQGLARGLGVPPQAYVCSPTFALVNHHTGRLALYHVDLYRMRHAASELIDLGLSEMLAHGVVLIEWAERAEEALPRPFWRIRLEHVAVSDRRLALERVE